MRPVSPSATRSSISVVIVAVMAGLTGWLARGLEPEPQIAPPMVTTPRVTHEDEVQSPSVFLPSRERAASQGGRNLFAYVTHQERPAMSRPRPVPPAPPVMAAAMVPLPIEQAVPPRMELGYRLIGRFGPEGNPIAAFVRDGQVVTVRAGERIGQHFIVRSIGLESVEVEAAHAGGIQRERIRLP